ncbi:DUF1249 domain-containing protein [Candidatus Methylospira mobilis]|uniref:DUF1249 domain-containing protein n=1 Tax=Candidatus Methylospira mobilis TaxID=1808979 RepID=A0A5Q0BEY5_9GAMM|nr:DUF1249 domain-containing protein [Candidatus Methylospira mobilis]QFY42069.1 DUF1249 domain-containing protein [Candidatus Methylospira mobilis]WNV03076.1 DUF1249 domain-containing protein [Candidatus Methylospira mobilis]
MSNATLNRGSVQCTLEPANKSFWLSRLCDQNYQKLARLLPYPIDELPDDLVGTTPGGPDLLLRRLELSPYTATIQLTHHFSNTGNHSFEPGIVMRVYLDACNIEALYDHQRAGACSCQPYYGAEMLALKWELNYFLSTWLDHCIRCDYQFEFESTGQRGSGRVGSF